MAFKMKGHALPGINQRGYDSAEDGKAKSAAFQHDDGTKHAHKMQPGVPGVKPEKLDIKPKTYLTGLVDKGPKSNIQSHMVSSKGKGKVKKKSNIKKKILSGVLKGVTSLASPVIGAVKGIKSLKDASKKKFNWGTQYGGARTGVGHIVEKKMKKEKDKK